MTKSKSAGIAHANASRDPPASPTWDFGAVNRSRSYCPFCPTTKKEAELLSETPWLPIGVPSFQSPSLFEVGNQQEKFLPILKD